MNKHDFHIPFIKSLAVVAVVTAVSMVFANYLVKNSLVHLQKSSSFTSQESQYSSQSPQ